MSRKFIISIHLWGFASAIMVMTVIAALMNNPTATVICAGAGLILSVGARIYDRTAGL